MTLVKVKNDNIPTRKSADKKKKERDIVYRKNGNIVEYKKDIYNYNAYHSNEIYRERKKEMMRRNIQFVREFLVLCKIIY
jgi:hypothetical protein